MPLAARLADPTTHGTPLAPGPGSTTCMIGFKPAWRTEIDQHACPAVNISGADGVGAVAMGCPTVFIDFQMACRQGDIVIEKPGLAMGPANPILLGCPTVMIGPSGGTSPGVPPILGDFESAGAAGGTGATAQDSDSENASIYSSPAQPVQVAALTQSSASGTPFCAACEKLHEEQEQEAAEDQG